MLSIKAQQSKEINALYGKLNRYTLFFYQKLLYNINGDIMKKLLTIFTLIISVVLITGCSPKTYNEISYQELTNMLKNKEDFVLVIGSETCSACKAFKPTMEKVIKEYKLDIKYIDISKLSEEDESELISIFAFRGTPATIFITDGKEEKTYNRIVGNEKYSKVVEKLKKNGYIKES